MNAMILMVSILIFIIIYLVEIGILISFVLTSNKLLLEILSMVFYLFAYYLIFFVYYETFFTYYLIFFTNIFCNSIFLLSGIISNQDNLSETLLDKYHNKSFHHIYHKLNINLHFHQIIITRYFFNLKVYLMSYFVLMNFRIF